MPDSFVDPLPIGWAIGGPAPPEFFVGTRKFLSPMRVSIGDALYVLRNSDMRTKDRKMFAELEAHLLAIRDALFPGEEL